MSPQAQERLPIEMTVRFYPARQTRLERASPLQSVPRMRLRRKRLHLPRWRSLRRGPQAVRALVPRRGLHRKERLLRRKHPRCGRLHSQPDFRMLPRTRHRPARPPATGERQRRQRRQCRPACRSSERAARSCLLILRLRSVQRPYPIVPHLEEIGTHGRRCRGPSRGVNLRPHGRSVMDRLVTDSQQNRSKRREAPYPHDLGRDRTCRCASGELRRDAAVPSVEGAT